MDKLIQPEREVTAQPLRAVLLNLGGLLLVLLLLGWVLSVATGTIAIRKFQDLVFANQFLSRRARLPLVKLFTGSDEFGLDTTVAGPDEDPTYHPHIGSAEWALRRENWNARWRYDVALAYWNEGERKQAEIDRQQSRLPGLTGEDISRTRQRIDQLTQEVAANRQTALVHLSLAVGQDPANAFYRETQAELAELLMIDARVRDDLRQKADRCASGSTYLLILYADRLRSQNRTQEALETYQRALGRLKAEFRSSVVDGKGELIAPQYQARIVRAFEEMLKNYDAWQAYVPDDAEVHLRLAEYLQKQATSTRNPEYAKMAAAERAKGLRTGLDLIAQGRQSPMVLFFMAQAYRAEGDLEQCIEYSRQASKLRPKDRGWCLALANAQWDLAQQLAVEAKSLKKTGETAKARLLQASAREYIEDAEESLTRLFKLAPSHRAGLELRRTIKDNMTRLFE